MSKLMELYLQVTTIILANIVYDANIFGIPPDIQYFFRFCSERELP